MADRKSLLHLRTLPPTMLALAVAGVSGPTLAQNVANGATLYQMPVNIPGGAPSSCQNCHGPAYIFKAASSAPVITANIAANRGGMGAFSGWTPAQINDVAAYVAAATPPTLPPLVQPPGTPAPAPAPTPAPAPAPVPPTAAPTTTPDVARFNSTEVGKESPTSGVMVTNTTAATVAFATQAITPPSDTKHFVVTTAPSGSTNCVPGYQLEPGTSCSFGVRFAPLATGTLTEKWTVNFDGTVPAREVTLEGTAIASATSTGASSTDSSAANSPAGGLGAVGWLQLLGLAGLAVAGRRRRAEP